MTQSTQARLLVILGCIISLAITDGTVVDMSHILDDRPTFPGGRPFNLSNINTMAILDGQYRIFGNYIQTAEHHNTHVDAPLHYCPDGKKMHEIPIDQFSGPGCILDFSAQAKANSDYMVTVEDVKNWETKNGQIPQNAIVVFNFGWSQYFGDLEKVFQTTTLDTPASYHFPGIRNDTVFYLGDRKINAVAVDTPAPDGAQHGGQFQGHIGFLCNFGILIAENVVADANVPATGSTIYIGAPKLKDGGGIPARVFAVIGSSGRVNSVQNILLMLSASLVYFIARI